MTLEPRDQDRVESELSTALRNDIYGVTNFTGTSFNYALLNSYANEVRDIEIRLLAALLAGSAEYAGKELTRQDMRELGYENVSPAEVNQYMDEQHLDLLATNNSVQREPATYAQTTVEFDTTDSSVEIEHGFEVSTGQPLELSYYCDVTGNMIQDDGTLDRSSGETISAESDGGGGYHIVVDAVAAEPGTEHNLGSGEITHIPNPKAGLDSVTNTEPADGGSPEQTTPSLRQDVKNAIFEQSLGGTLPGLGGALNRETSEDISANLDEYTNLQPPYVDVVVDGATEADLLDIIAEFKPLGVRHNLLRPATLDVAVTTDVVGQDIDTSIIEDDIRNLISNLGVGDDLYWSDIVQTIRQSPVAVTSTAAVNIYTNVVKLEYYKYVDGQTIYKLNHRPLSSVTNAEYLVTSERLNTGFDLYHVPVDDSNLEVRVRVDGALVTLDSADYTITTASGDATLTIDSSVDVDVGTILKITYTVDDSAIGIDGVYIAGWEIDGESDMRGTQLNTSEYDVVTNSDGHITAIDISPYGGTLDEDNRIVVDYTAQSSANGDIIVSENELVQAADVLATENQR